MEELGEWWVPDREADSIPGVLRGDPAAGLELTLLTKRAEALTRARLERFPLVLGRSSRGEEFSLLRCWESGIQGREVTIQVDSAIRGAHLGSLSEEVIRQATVRFKHLSGWAEQSGFSITDLPVDGYEVRSVPIADREVEVGEDLIVRLFRIYNFPFFPDADGELLLVNRPAVELRFNPPTTLSRAWQEIEILRCFFSLAALRHAEVEEVGLELVPSSPDSSGQLHPRYVEYLPQHYLRDRQGRPPAGDWYLFREEELGSELPSALRRWMEQGKLLEAPRVLYLASCYLRETIESQFLGFCHALESLCGAVRPGRYMEPEEFSANVLPSLTSAIPSIVSSSFRASIKARLKYLNSYSLRRQIELLVAEHSSVLESLGADLGGVADGIVDERNRLTHPPPGGYILSEEHFDHLDRLSNLARLLLELTFLRELGLSGARTSQLASKCQDYRHKIWREHGRAKDPKRTRGG